MSGAARTCFRGRGVEALVQDRALREPWPPPPRTSSLHQVPLVIVVGRFGTWGDPGRIGTWYACLMASYVAAEGANARCGRSHTDVSRGIVVLPLQHDDMSAGIQSRARTGGGLIKRVVPAGAIAPAGKCLSD